MGEREKKISMKTIEFKLQYKYFYIYLNNKDHNKNFPTCVHSDGDRFWYLNDKLHNPYEWAVKNSDGDIYYYLNDVYYTKEQWEIERKKYL